MSADAFTAQAIQPLVSHQQVQGRHLILTFTCPTSGKHVQARWTAPQSSGITSQVARQAKQTMWYEMRRSVLSAISGALGYGMTGRIAQQAVSSAMYGMSPTRSGATQLSAAEVQTGLVEAFRSVSSQFVWHNGKWVHSSAAGSLMSDFDRQLHDHPMTSRYDRLLTARMLVEVASAHGGIGDDERLQLGSVIASDLGSLEGIISRPPLTRAELSEASEGGVRTSMLAVAWSIALTDEHLAEEERVLLERFAAELGVQGSRARELAQGWLIDQALDRAFSWGQHDPNARAHILKLGGRIGLSQEEVERFEARFQKRRA